MRILERSHPEKIVFSLPVETSRPLRNKPKAEVAPDFRAAGCNEATNVGFINGSKKLEIVPFSTVPDDAIYTGTGVALINNSVSLPFGLGRVKLTGTSKSIPIFRKNS